MAVVFMIALILRMGWGVVGAARGGDAAALEFPDEQQYWLMAQSLRAGDGLKDELGFRATRMPLYPAMLALFADGSSGVAAARALHWALGALGAAIAAGFGCSMFGRRVGLAAGILVAFDPFLVFFSSLLLTEVPSVVSLMILSWAVWAALADGGKAAPTRRWIAVGLASAAAVYVREASLLIVAAFFVLLLAADRFRPKTVLGVFLAGLILTASLVPWAWRNHRLIGDWCWLTTRGGISLYDGVGPQATGASDLGDLKAGPEVAGLSEVEWNRYFMRESLAAVRKDPGRILKLAAVKLGRTWNPLPNVETYRSSAVRMVAAVWTIPTFALALAGVILLMRAGIVERHAERSEASGPASGEILRCAQNDDVQRFPLRVICIRMSSRDRMIKVALLLAPAFCQAALHSLFVGSVRYRLVAMPSLEILAAVALVVLLGGLASPPRRERRSTLG